MFSPEKKKTPFGVSFFCVWKRGGRWDKKTANCERVWSVLGGTIVGELIISGLRFVNFY